MLKVCGELAFFSTWKGIFWFLEYRAYCGVLQIGTCLHVIYGCYFLKNLWSFSWEFFEFLVAFTKDRCMLLHEISLKASLKPGPKFFVGKSSVLCLFGEFLHFFLGQLWLLRIDDSFKGISILKLTQGAKCISKIKNQVPFHFVYILWLEN